MRKTETATPTAGEGIDLSPGRPVFDVILDLNRKLASDLNTLSESGFGWQRNLPEEHQHLPEHWAWIACYVVRGGSEGYWIHLDLIMADRVTRRNIGLCKTWSWQAAFTLCNTATRLLHDL